MSKENTFKYLYMKRPYILRLVEENKKNHFQFSTFNYFDMKITCILSAIAFGAILLAGCVKEGIETGNDAVAVTFTPDITTRVSGTTWDDGDAIGIFMVNNGTTDVVSGSGNRQYSFNGSVFQPSSGNDIYYPEDGSKVDFIAYYPYKTGQSGFSYSISLANQSSPTAIDLMTAKTVSGYDKNNTNVPLAFSHQLSKLIINVVKGTGMTSVDFTGMTVSVEGMPLTASFALTDGTIGNINLGNFAPRTVTAGVQYDAILIPQTAGVYSGRKVVFSIPGENDLIWTIPDATPFAQGTRNTYTITISKTGITVSFGTITDWITTDPATPGTVEVQTYKIGDYYPNSNVNLDNPAEKAKILGVVFWLKDPEQDGSGVYRSTQGKIVNLNEGISIKFYGGTESPDLLGLTAGDGRVNMSIIADYIPAYGRSWMIHFPAFNWIVETLNHQVGWDDARDRWYLPAKDELLSLYNAYNGGTGAANTTARTAFNKILTDAGGAQLFPDKFSYMYWTSTDDTTNNLVAWCIRFDDGTPALTARGFAARVRAVADF